MDQVARTVERLRAEVRADRVRLREEYAAHGNAPRLLASRCQRVDSILTRLWRSLDFPPDLALAAVGGYGRGELYPASDIDLLILLPAPPDAALRTRLERLVSAFWDIGLEVGHSVRTAEECFSAAAADITVQTALLESRLLTGATGLFSGFFKELFRRLDPAAFYDAKRLEQQERHWRYHDTGESLEPHCKDSPGGLRDLQVIFWIARAAGYGASWADLEKNGLLTREEMQYAVPSEAFLQHLRIRLHLLTGRREDRLLFDYQETLAIQDGLVDTSARRASEQLMQRYYRTAKAVSSLNTLLLQNLGAALSPDAEQAVLPINAWFQSVGGLLDIRENELFERRPASILESFVALQENPELKGMTARTLRALWRARRRITPEYRADPENRACFVRFLKNPRGIVRELRRMNQLDILGAYLPSWGGIVGQMQHDLFHVYTVDQHSLQVVRNLRRFTMPEFAHEYPLCSSLIGGFERHWLLYVAALFHDIAKGRGGDHSELGTVDARQFCVGHALSEEDTELVVWLVRHHLLMSQVAQKEDLSDPDVISGFSGKVGDPRRLTALYLLTHADVRGTSPKVWNQWKAKLLSDLYDLALHRLGREDAPAPQGIIAGRQAEALRLLCDFALPGSVHERLWKQLDTVYFLRHSAEEIAWHTRALHYRIANDRPVVKARPRAEGEGLEVMVYTRDQPDLFVRLVGFFARAGYTIVDAKIHTTRHGYALDSFVLLDISGRDDDPALFARIEHELCERLERWTPPEAPSPGRLSRQVKHFPIKPEVLIEPDDKEDHYVLTLVAADRPGLLYTIAATLAEHGASLYTAKIATLGERAEDAFLIGGEALATSAGRIQLETALIERLKVGKER